MPLMIFITLVLAGLKLFDVANIEWMWVFSPIWVFLLLAVALAFIIEGGRRK